MKQFIIDHCNSAHCFVIDDDIRCDVEFETFEHDCLIIALQQINIDEKETKCSQFFAF